MSLLGNTIFNHRISITKKAFAILIDPDKSERKHLSSLVDLAQQSGVDFFFVGGSLITTGKMGNVIKFLKSKSNIPVVIFPGSNIHLSEDADALLFLSLISGRNPEFLIGQHVASAPMIKEMQLDVIPTGYLLIDGGNNTSVAYMSNTKPIPSDKYDIAASTALAGEMLGMHLIYLDSGSGARKPVHPKMISRVRSVVSLPIVVGGGIKDPETAESCCNAGADVIVVGNAIEKDPLLISELSASIHSSQTVE